MEQLEFPLYKLPAFKKKLSQLNRLCVKLDMPMIGFNEVSRNMVKRYDSSGKQYHVEYVTVDMVNVPDLIKLPNNSRVIGVIDHVNGLIHSLKEDNTIPAHYYQRMTCDHCNTNRQRNTTIIIQDMNTLKYMQVGTACLKLYTGIDGMQVLDSVVSFSRSFKDFTDYENDAFNYGIRSYSLVNTLALSIEVINNQGFVSQSKADSSFEVSTACIVRDMLDSRIQPLKDSINKAERVLNVLRNEVKPTNEYLQNILTIIESDYAVFKTVGFICSMYPLFQKVMEHTATVKASNHVGTANEKISAHVFHVMTRTFESMYGIQYFHTFKDSNENVLIWKSSTFPKWLENMTDEQTELKTHLTINATVKGHNEYKGQKQTNIIRVKPV